MKYEKIQKKFNILRNVLLWFFFKLNDTFGIRNKNKVRSKYNSPGCSEPCSRKKSSLRDPPRVHRSLPPLPPPSTVTVAAPTPPETPAGPGDVDGTPPSPQFVYVSAAVSAAPLTPPASEYSSDAENTPADATGPNADAAAAATVAGTATTTVYGLIDYVIERSAGDGAFGPLPSKDRTARKSSAAERCGPTTATAHPAVACDSGNRG